MDIGIGVEIFEPASPDNLKTGTLYLDKDNKDYVEVSCGFDMVFKNVYVFYATATDGGQKYTLINCSFRQSKGNVCRFAIQELYRGGFIGKATERDCLEVEARITGLTSWINKSRIRNEIKFGVPGPQGIKVEDDFIVEYSLQDDVQLQLTEYCRVNLERDLTIVENLSSVKLVAKAPISRIDLYKSVIAFQQLLSLFVDGLPKMTRLSFQFVNHHEIEHLTSRELKAKVNQQALLKYDRLEPYMQPALNIFYKRCDNFMQVLELLIASIKNTTAEISFLNITTAFEVIHKHFHEGSDSESVRHQLVLELLQKGIIKSSPNRWDQITRYWHLFKLTDNIAFVKTSFPNPETAISLIRDSRNYYTHYGTTKGKVWTPNQLFFATRLLRQMLKAVVLLELKIPENLINELLNNRASVLYHDYEHNEYSLLYRDST